LRTARGVLVCIGLLAALAAAGCRSTGDVTPAALDILGPATRADLLGTSQQARFVVLGARQRTLLGGQSIPPAAGVRVDFDILSQPAGAQARIETPRTATDAGGTVQTTLVLGNAPGVYRLRATLPDHPAVRPRTITYLAGLKVLHSGQDGWVRQSLDQPISVLVQQAPGQGAPEAVVEFDLRHGPPGTRLSSAQATTDDHGFASIQVTLGDRQGKGAVGVRLLESPLGDRASQYTVQAEFLAIDPVWLPLTVVGGLAIFIFGMRLMSEGLSLVAGDRLRALLGFLTRNRFAAVGVGALTTGLIQSSSACTVMVVGFVNAGLMQLEQAIGVIMGSNIGTTVTAQMISFKLGVLALPAIAVGVVLMLLARRQQVRFASQILIGFGLLFLGMSMMSDTLKGLQDSVTLRGIFDGLAVAPQAGRVFSVWGLVVAVGAGALLTIIVQSSSASIGLLMALAGAGLVDVYTAFAILLGDNIGTTVTAALASIGTSRNAKRAALAHFLFNSTGTAVMIALVFVPWPGTDQPVFMQLVAHLTAGDPFAGENLPRYLANAHTLFNVSCTVLFVGFVSTLAWMCRAVVRGEDPEDPARRMRRFLEPHLLRAPSIAIQQAQAELAYMLRQSRAVTRDAFRAIAGLGDPDWEQLADSVRERERDVDALQIALTDYVRDISLEHLTTEQGRTLPRLLHSVNDAERIADHGIQLLRLARRMRKRSLPFTEDAQAQMSNMCETVSRLFDQCLFVLDVSSGAEWDSEENKASLRRNYREARATWRRLKDQESDYRKDHVSRYESGACDMRAGAVFVAVLLSLLRIGGHLMNIIQAATPDPLQSR